MMATCRTAAIALRQARDDECRIDGPVVRDTTLSSRPVFASIFTGTVMLHRSIAPAGCTYQASLRLRRDSIISFHCGVSVRNTRTSGRVASGMSARRSTLAMRTFCSGLS